MVGFYPSDVADSLPNIDSESTKKVMG